MHVPQQQGRTSKLAGSFIWNFKFQLSTFLLLALTAPLNAETIDWPSREQFLRVLTLQDHNTRVVMLGVAMLGLASGLIGSFLLLRKRSLLGDAVSHATLPGIGIAFLVMTAFGIDGKSMPGLLLGATVFGVLGIAAILAIVHTTRIKQDAALGIVLSVFFGLGIAILGIVQQLPGAAAAGLESFIYGKAASMLSSESWTITISAGVIAVACLALFKEFGLLCFDSEFAAAQGMRVLLLDSLLMTLVVGVTVIGLQAVGLILVVALLIIPPAAARFWTHHLPTMVIAAAILGAISGVVGAALSALFANLPAGGIIVLTAGVFFFISMVFGPAKGVLVRWIERRSINFRIARQNLLRGLYELSEEGVEGAAMPHFPVSLSELHALRSWSAAALRRAIRRAVREGLVQTGADNRHLRLTPDGVALARRIVRNHRLWELFLIHHADIAPSHVDRDADTVEHVLRPEMIEKLEAIMAAEQPVLATPSSPHEVAARR